jgi:hypothetical protein
MAAAFNLTAQINLRGPSNTKVIASQIRKQLSNIKVKVNLDLKGSAAKNVTKVNKQLQLLQQNAAKANASVASLSATVSQLGAGLNNLGGSGGVQSLNKVQKQVQSTGSAISSATTQVQEFGKQSGLAIRRFAAFSAVTGVVYSLTNAINSAFKEFVAFDKQIVRLSQVTGTTVSGLSGITKEISNLSSNLGVASSDLAQVSVTLSQAGLSAQETKIALEALAKSALAPSFDNLNNTVEGSIALMRQFSISSGELEAALGSVNAVAASFAVEAGDIIAAIQRTGGVFASSSRGISEGTAALNEFVALFTSVRATTRESAETIATGLRTIFTRIQRGSTIESLKEFGITLTDLQGKFVGPFEAVKRLSEGLKGLDPRDLRFGQIVEELGGFRQIGKVIPLIQQFATAQKALGVAQSGQGSLSKAAIQAQASLAVQFEKTRQSFVSLVRDIGNSTTFRGIAKVALTTANAFITLASALKPLLPMITALAAFKGVSALSEFGGGFLGGFGGKGGGGGGGGGPSGPMGPIGPSSGGSVSGRGSGRRNKGSASNNKALAKNSAALNANTTALGSVNTSMASLLQSIDALSEAINNKQSGVNTQGFASGGLVPGSGNRDTVSAMLTPGEYVIRKKAVEKIGADNLKKLNRGGRVQRFTGGGGAEALTVDDIKIFESGQNAGGIPKGQLKNMPSSLAQSVIDRYKGKGKLNQETFKALKEKVALKAAQDKAVPYALVGLRGTAKEVFAEADDGTMVKLIGRTLGETDDNKPYEDTMFKDFKDTVAKVANQMATKVQAQPVSPGDLNKDAMEKAGFFNAVGAYLEAAVASIGAPYDKDQSNDPLDFAQGLGSASGLFGLPSDMPADTTRTVFSSGKSPADFLKQVNNYRAKLAGGGSVSDTVPALLTPGEYVINEKSAKKLGSQKLDQLNRADRIQGYASGGPVGFVQRLASGGSPRADKMEYLERVAKKLGMTVSQYEKSIRSRILQGAETRATEKTGMQGDLKDVIVKNIQSIGDADVEGMVRTEVSDLVKKIYTGYDEIDPDLLNQGIDELVQGMKAGLSLDEIKNMSDGFKEILDAQITAGDELSGVTEEMAKKLGFLTSRMKVRDIDMKASGSQKAGKFGALDDDLRKAQKSIESGVGSILDGFSEAVSLQNLPGMKKLSSAYPELTKKITTAGDKLGGTFGLIGTGATLLSSKMPELGHAFDELAGTVSDQSAAFAGFTGALQKGGSLGMSAGIVGGQAFGRRGAAVGGAAGLAAGAVTGFIDASIVKETELAFKGIAAASAELDKTFNRLDTAVTVEERAALQEQAAEDYNKLNAAIQRATDTIDGNRLWKSFSAGISGMTTAMISLIGVINAVKLAQVASALLPGKVSGGIVKGYASGGFAKGGQSSGMGVPVRLASGEAVFTPPLPGTLSEMKQLNQIDRGGSSSLSRKGQTGGSFIVPGNSSGKVDNQSAILPENSFVLRRDATDTLKAMRGGPISAATGGLIGSGSVGFGGSGGIRGYSVGGNIQGYFGGGRVASALLAKLVANLGRLGPAITAGFGRMSPALKAMTGQLATMVGISALTGLFSGFFSFFMGSAERDRAILQQQLQQLENLNTLVGNQQSMDVRNEAFADRLIPAVDAIENSGLSMDQKEMQFGRFRTPGGRMNDANLLGEMTARQAIGADADLEAVGQNQSVQEYLDSLDPTQRQKANAAIDKAQGELLRSTFIEKRKREGMDEVEASRVYDSDPQAAKAEAQEALGEKSRAEGLAKRMQIINRSINKFTLNLVDVMNRLGSVMNRTIGDLNANIDKMSQVSDIYSGGQAGSLNPNEDNVRILSNITAASNAELAQAVGQINKDLGDTKETQTMAGLIKGIQVLQKELPLILRQTGTGGDLDAGSETSIRGRLDTMFQGLDIGENLKRDLKSNVINFINDKTGSRQGDSFEDLANYIDGLKELDEAAEQARATFEKYAKEQADFNRKLGGLSNQLSAQLSKLADNAIRVKDIQLNSALQLSEKFNKTLSLSSLNAPFMNSVSGLTGGTTDPEKIGRELASAIERQRQIEADPNSQTTALGSGEVAKLTSKINKYQKALDILATSTDRASNALKKIDEQQRISSGRRSGVMSFLSNINNPEALLGMRQEQQSYSNVMAGTGTITDIARGTNSLNMMESTQTPEQFQKTQQKFFENAMRILEANGANPAVFKQFRESFAGDFAAPDANPAVKPFIDAYQEAARIQTEAVKQQSNLLNSGAVIAADTLKKSADAFATKMKEATAEIVKEFNAVADRLGLGKPKDSNKMSSGGVVYASAGQFVNFTPKGTDTVPAMLTPGEFVVNRSATSKNLPLLKSINSGGYSSGGSVGYYADGGQIGPGLKTVNRNFNLLSPYPEKSLDNFQEYKDHVPYGYMDRYFGNKDSAVSERELKSMNQAIQKHQKQYFTTTKVNRYKSLRSLVPEWEKNEKNQDKQASFWDWITGSSPDRGMKFNSGNFKSVKDAKIFAGTMEAAHGIPLGRGVGTGDIGSSTYSGRFYGGDSSFPMDSATSQGFGELLQQRIIQSRSTDWEAFFYGLASKALPTIGGIIGGGIGAVLGGTAAVASGGLGAWGVPIFTVAGAMGGNMAGHAVNSFAYSMLPDSWQKRIEQKVNDNPGSYNAGQWLGFGADVVAGGMGANAVAKGISRSIPPRAIVQQFVRQGGTTGVNAARPTVEDAIDMATKSAGTKAANNSRNIGNKIPVTGQPNATLNIGSVDDILSLPPGIKPSGGARPTGLPGGGARPTGLPGPTGASGATGGAASATARAGAIQMKKLAMALEETLYAGKPQQLVDDIMSPNGKGIYEVLGRDPQIQSATFRKLQKLLHPDMMRHSKMFDGMGLDDAAIKLFQKRLSSMKTVLDNSLMRADYDQLLGRGHYADDLLDNLSRNGFNVRQLLQPGSRAAAATPKPKPGSQAPPKPKAESPKPKPDQPKPGQPKPKPDQPKPGQSSKPKPGQSSKPKPGQSSKPKPGQSSKPKPGETPKPSQPKPPTGSGSRTWSQFLDDWMGGSVGRGYYTGSGIGEMLSGMLGFGLTPDPSKRSSSQSESPKPLPGGYPDKSSKAKDQAAKDAIEQMTEKTKRTFGTTDRGIMDQVQFGTDGQYKFGQVQNAAASLKLKDPLKRVNFLYRNISIPEFELGMGGQGSTGVAEGQLLTQKQRKDAEEEYLFINKKVSDMYSNPSAHGNTLQAYLQRRGQLKTMLDSDFRAQYNLGVPTGDKPTFNLKPPVKPNTEPPTEKEKRMLRDGVIDDNATLQGLLAQQDTGTANRKNSTVMAGFTQRFSDLEETKNTEGASFALLKKFNSVKLDYIKAFGQVKGVSDKAIDPGLLSVASTQEQVDAEVKALKTDISSKTNNKDWMAGNSQAQATDKQKIKTKADIAKMVAKYSEQSGVTDPKKLKDWLQKQSGIRQELKGRHSLWDNYYTKEKEFKDKELEHLFQTERWGYRDELKKNPEGRMYGDGSMGMNSLEYLLFNHPAKVAHNFINPFNQNKSTDELLYGAPLGTVKPETHATRTQNAIRKYLKSFGKSLGIQAPIDENTNVDEWFKNLDPNLMTDLNAEGNLNQLMKVGNESQGATMLDILKNMYQPGSQEVTDNVAARFGLWSVVGADDARNKDFGKEYQSEFLRRLYKYVESTSTQKSKESFQMTESVDTYLKMIDALAAYTGQMDPAIYGKASDNFGPLVIPKQLKGKTEKEQMKNLSRVIGRDFYKYTRSTFDYEFGGITSAEDYGKVGDRLGIQGYSPEDLRRTVFADRNTLRRIYERKAYSVGGGLTTADTLVNTGMATLFNANKDKTVDSGDLANFYDLDGNVLSEGTTIMGLISKALDFGKRMPVANRQGMIDYAKDFDFKGNLADDSYAKYEENLDNNLHALKSTYKLWDSLVYYSKPNPGTTKAETVDLNAAGPVLQSATAGGSINIAGTQIPSVDFLSKYQNALETTGAKAYGQIVEAGSIFNDHVGGSSNFTLAGAPNPFDNPEFIALKKFKQLQEVGTVNAATGGHISGGMGAGKASLVNYKPVGTDTVPAMLTPGEYVINRSATQQHLPLLKAINNGGLSYASNGGMIQPQYKNIGGLASSALSYMGGGGLDMGNASRVFDGFVSSFSKEIASFGGLINNLAKVFPALSGPVNNFGNHVDKLAKSLNDLQNIEIKGPNIPETIRLNSDAIRVEIDYVPGSNKLSPDAEDKLASQVAAKLKTLVDLGRIS